MGEVPLSLHLSKQIVDDMAREASRQNASLDEIAHSAIQAYLDWQTSERSILQQRIEEAKKGVFVSSEAVLEWMEALESDPNAAFPEPDVFPPQRS